jgi:SAM-dependent methyltransferase
MPAIDANEAERRRWNDCAWAGAWPKRERLTTAVTDVLLEHAGLEPGERVLDVGTGGGVAALAAAGIVGAGSVVGADISAPLIELARRRGEQAGAGNVSFVLADVQQESVPGAPFDVVISQFGVMFFDEPQRAFANIRAQLRSEGRLCFACWRGPELNPWFTGPAVAALAKPPARPAPGKSPTHPFSLADPDATAKTLRASGWRDIHRSAHDMEVTVERDTVVDTEALGFFGVPAESAADAWDLIERQLAPMMREDGRLEVPLAFQVFTATA